ncbi:MAG: tyrosine-type recombinase/integrase [Nanoarchaeota archaeon]|nr:tyrosine-type recombinase/integrase [Nanoarchaeota archaeon]MBU1028404.1 tyrosine-type recombinase/integrase [Nanoarchaeota archaeon]
MSYYPVDIEKAVLKECKRRRLSPRTAKTYIYCINRFLKWCKQDIGKISKKDVRLFLDYLSEKDLSGNSLNTYHMAIRFLFVDVLDKKMWINIKYSKVPEKLPCVLSKEEIKRLLNAITNWKHRLMIEFLYSSGLRVSELLNIKIKDLELDKNFGYVRNGKGGKDRLIILSKVVKEKIKNLIEMENLEKQDFLFQSNRNKKYSVRSIQKIIRKSSQKSKIEKWKEIHPHTLRHSFATQLIENGYDISQVQALLGHKSPETTMVYTHISSPKMINVKSPLDNL